MCKRCASFFPLSGSLDVSNAEGKCDMLLQSAAYLEVLSKTTLNHSRVLLSSIVLVYSETLRTVPLLKVPVLSAHLPDKRAPCILPCYAGSAFVPSSRDQDRAAVDHLVFIASSLTSNESSRFLGIPLRLQIQLEVACGAFKNMVFFWHGWQFFVELPGAVSGEQLWWSQYRSRTQSIVIR